MEKQLTIVQIYPNDMNIYGDWGNVLTVQRRAEQHGYQPVVIDYNPGDTFPDQVDIIIGGGGQDSGQTRVANDLAQHRHMFHDLADAEVPMLVICGTYQLFGNQFITHDHQTMEGIGIFDAETVGGTDRLIGNVIVESDEFGAIYGYENHSGVTTLAAGVPALGVVKQGAGNNGIDGREGARYKNVVGSYLHGSLLPKNPALADFLIKTAAINRYGEFFRTNIDDQIAERARVVAANRPR